MSLDPNQIIHSKPKTLTGNILGTVLLILVVAYGLDFIVAWLFGKPYLYCLSIIWFSKSGIGASTGLIMFVAGVLITVLSKNKSNGIALIVGAFLIGLMPDLLAHYLGMGYDCR
ncbi:MAG TPA: hypothetical protein ENJ30_07535 [Desulfobulbaceae bacterium]|nr:hypothetical protein [Desulfobulbaceae bacterium]